MVQGLLVFINEFTTLCGMLGGLTTLESEKFVGIFLRNGNAILSVSRILSYPLLTLLLFRVSRVVLLLTEWFWMRFR